MPRVIIVEDEFSPRRMLRNKLEHFDDMEIVAECENAEDALIQVLRLRPDLLFLDIQMPGKNGLWLADELMQMKIDTFTPPDIIFTTGYVNSEYMLKAFELAAVGYLVKPISIGSLEKAITRFREQAGKTTGLQNLKDAIGKEQLLKLKSCNGLFMLRPSDIAYIEADRDYASIFFSNGVKDDVFERLGEIEKKFPKEIFLRIGRSIIVNREYIRKITGSSLQLTTPDTEYTIKISREAIRQLKEII